MITNVVLDVGGALSDRAGRADSAGEIARPEHVLPNRPGGAAGPGPVSCRR